MENKAEFLEKVLHLFYLNGAKTTTMDDIAKAFSMSKKTLYQQYANKEELLDEVLSFELQQIVSELKLLDKKDDCPIEKMLYREKKMKDMTENNHSLFIQQLKKYYYNLYERQTKRIEEEVSKILASNIEKGIELGLYRTDFDVKKYIQFLMLIMFSYDDSPIIDHNEVSRKQFTLNAILFYLNAITTEKGKEKLEKIIHITNDE